jgi:hypothetical protein
VGELAENLQQAQLGAKAAGEMEPHQVREAKEPQILVAAEVEEELLEVREMVEMAVREL